MMDAFAGLFNDGGFVMPPLLGCALLIWYSLGDRFLTLRRGDRRATPQLWNAACTSSTIRCRGLIDTAAHRLANAAKRQRVTVYLADELVQDLVIETNRHARLIKTLVIIAPLAGLLGTVSGMMETFSSLSEMALFAQSGGIAGGIAEALLTTQMGLAVAIPGIIAGRILERTAKQRLSELSDLKQLAVEGGVA